MGGRNHTARRPRLSALRELLVHRIGRRGAALLFFALLDAVYSFSLFNPPEAAKRNPSLQFVGAAAPLWVWAVLWLAAGVVCAVNAFRVNDKLGFAAAIAIKVLWGTIYVAGAVTGVIERAYVSATIWLCLAGWVAIIASWPEPTDMSWRDRPPPEQDRSGRYGRRLFEDER